jgi:hypothetical protein
VFWNGCGKKQQCKFRKSRRIIELGWNRERLKIEYLVSGQAIKKEQSKDTKRGAHRNDEGQPQERLFFYDGAVRERTVDIPATNKTEESSKRFSVCPSNIICPQTM